jgi:hypothetical protein
MQAVAAITEGAALKAELTELDRLCPHIPTDTISSRRRIAEAVLDASRR